MSALIYLLAAILASLQYDKTGSSLILAGLIIGLLPALIFCFGCICMAQCDKSAVPILSIFFVALGGFSLLGAALIFTGVAQEAKKNSRDIDPDYNPAQVIAAGVLFALSGLFHCIGFGLCGGGCYGSDSESPSSED